MLLAVITERVLPTANSSHNFRQASCQRNILKAFLEEGPSFKDCYALERIVGSPMRKIVEVWEIPGDLWFNGPYVNMDPKDNNPLDYLAPIFS